MSPRTKASQQEEPSPGPAEPLTAEQLKDLYQDPDSIIPEHNLVDLVQGMRRVWGFQE